MCLKIQLEINIQSIVKYFDHISIPLLLLSTSGLMCLYTQGPGLKRSQSCIPNYVIHSLVPKYQWEFAIYIYGSIYRYYRCFDSRLLYTDIFEIPSLEFENDLLYISQGKRKINAINAGVQNVYSCVLIGVLTINSPNA